MKPVRSVNFNRPPQAWLFGHAAARRRWLALLPLAVAALLLAAAVAASAMQRAALAARQTQQAAALPPPRAMAAAPSASAPTLAAAERTRLNRVVRSLNAPWAPIFQALEAQSSAKVAVLALETDTERGTVRVLTEGPALDELLAHAQRVQDSAPFVRAQLLRIEAPETGGPATASATPLSRLSFDLMLAR